jgi:hypothetical protein
MAFKTGGTGNGAATQTERLEPYFKRLKPVAELVYAGAEVRIFDDREASGEIKLQFFQSSERGRKAAVFTMTDESFGELVQDLGQVLGVVTG